VTKRHCDPVYGGVFTGPAVYTDARSSETQICGISDGGMILKNRPMMVGHMISIFLLTFCQRRAFQFCRQVEPVCIPQASSTTGRLNAVIADRALSAGPQGKP
jgi:hypothetical protein